MSEQNKNSEEKSSESYKFKTLRGYGKFLSGLGSILVIIGILGILYALSLFSGYRSELQALYFLGGSFALFLNGIFLIVFGQTISCFVEIEKNTRMTYEILLSKS